MQKYVSLNNQQCMTQPTLNNLHRNKFKDYDTIHLQLI